MVQLGSTTIVAQTVRPSGVTPQREPSHTLRGVPIKLSISLTDLSQLAKEAPRADGSQASLPEALAVQDPSTSPTESLTVPSPPTSDFEVTPDDPHAPIAPWLHGKSPAQGSHLPEGEEGGALESKGEDALARSLLIAAGERIGLNNCLKNAFIERRIPLPEFEEVPVAD